MQVFLCWSGTRSKAIASVLRDWLRDVIQTLEPWMSEHDIIKGYDWFTEIGEQLHETPAAVVCLTPEIVAEPPPWMMFESGAIYANSRGNMVCTYLLGVANGDVPGPLSKFQATQANKTETRKMLSDMNRLDGGPRLDEAVLDRAFSVQWPRLEEHIREISEMSVEPGAAPKRADSDKIDEILGVVRRLDKGRFGGKEFVHRATSDSGVELHAGGRVYHIPRNLAGKLGWLTQQPNPTALYDELAQLVQLRNSEAHRTKNASDESESADPARHGGDKLDESSA